MSRRDPYCRCGLLLCRLPADMPNVKRMNRRVGHGISDWISLVLGGFIALGSAIVTAVLFGQVASPGGLPATWYDAVSWFGATALALVLHAGALSAGWRLRTTDAAAAGRGHQQRQFVLLTAVLAVGTAVAGLAVWRAGVPAFVLGGLFGVIGPIVMRRCWPSPSVSEEAVDR